LLLRLKRALGLATAAEKWDDQYARGRWDWLARLDELAHYSVLAGYALELKPGGELLDVGCGEGLFRARLHSNAFSRYVGIDFREAIQRAAPRVDDRTTFELGDMRTYVPTTKFDTIVFNEVLYYFTDPMAGMARYDPFLKPGGILLVSTFIKDVTPALWRQIEERYDLVDRVTITNVRGTRWVCAAMLLKNG
jgi:2-polyprenyl-3-methyl-5-hydroxy-6-metoxy-1,4-benzoquinol methylase